MDTPYLLQESVEIKRVSKTQIYTNSRNLEHYVFEYPGLAFTQLTRNRVYLLELWIGGWPDYGYEFGTITYRTKEVNAVIYPWTAFLEDFKRVYDTRTDKSNH